jgi:hypothetical protein
MFDRARTVSIHRRAAGPGKPRGEGTLEAVGCRVDRVEHPPDLLDGLRGHGAFKRPDRVHGPADGPGYEHAAEESHAPGSR